MTERKVPRIRFKGFTDDWEQRKFGDITSSYSGGTPAASRSDYYGGTIPFIRSGEISSDHTELFLSESGLKNSSAAMVKKGDILYALYGATSGEVSISRLNGAINQAILAIIPNHGFDANFIMQWLRNSKQSITTAYLQGGQGNLSAAIVKQLQITLPSYAEQYQIGTFFSNLDNLITLHQRKLKKLQLIKKSMLEKCFPKKGEKVPRLRFSGFTNDWEQRKLGDCCDIYSGFMGNSLLNDGQFRLTRIETIANGVIDETRIGYSDKDPGEDNKLNVGDILFSNINSLDHIGKIAQYRKNIGLYHGINLLRLVPGRGTSSNFLFYELSTSEKRNWAQVHANQAVSQASINRSQLSKETIEVCSFDEQCQIGIFFSKIDDLITLHQRKLDKLHKIKESMLEQMFV